MFGQQDNQQDQNNTAIPDQSIDAAVNETQSSDDWQHPGQPLTDDNPAPAAAPAPVSDDQGAPVDGLIGLKQQALGQLSPLLQHLEQTPEDKFRTLMMMIQATDDQSKLQDAYTAAQAIPDEKVRAQALLDVINEINYFTQHPAE